MSQTCDDLRDVAHNENMKCVAEMDAIDVEIKSMEKSPEKSPDQLFFKRVFKAQVGTQAAVARQVHIRLQIKTNKNKALIRSAMDNKLADAEMTQKFYFCLLEEFLQEYRDALDDFRRDLRFLYSLLEPHERLTMAANPLPPRIAKSLPPRNPLDVDYDAYDKDAAAKRTDELSFYHKQLVTEKDQILKYREVAENDPNGPGFAEFTVKMLICRLMRAIEFYTLNNDIGRCLYSEESRQEHVRMIDRNRKDFEMAGFDHNGFPIQPQQ